MQILTLPRWHGSGPTHWQSRWEQLHGHRRVEQHHWQQPRRGDWMARLDEVLQEGDSKAGGAGRSQPGLPAGGGVGRPLAPDVARVRRAAGGAAETIHTEITRKFTLAEVRSTLTAAGFTLVRWYTPANRYFGLALEPE